eukprot:2270250-Rhodomonas_salina.1
MGEELATVYNNFASATKKGGDAHKAIPMYILRPCPCVQFRLRPQGHPDVQFTPLRVQFRPCSSCYYGPCPIHVCKLNALPGTDPAYAATRYRRALELQNNVQEAK